MRYGRMPTALLFGLLLLLAGFAGSCGGGDDGSGSQEGATSEASPEQDSETGQEREPTDDSALHRQRPGKDPRRGGSGLFSRNVGFCAPLAVREYPPNDDRGEDG